MYGEYVCTCTRACVCMCVYVCVYVCMCVCVRTRARIRVYMCVHVHVYIHVCVQCTVCMWSVDRIKRVYGWSSGLKCPTVCGYIWALIYNNYCIILVTYRTQGLWKALISLSEEYIVERYICMHVNGLYCLWKSMNLFIWYTSSHMHEHCSRY